MSQNTAPIVDNIGNHYLLKNARPIVITVDLTFQYKPIKTSMF